MKEMEYWKLNSLKLTNTRLLMYLVSIALISLLAMLASITRMFPPGSRSLLTSKADFHFQLQIQEAQTLGQRNNGAVEIKHSLDAGGRKLLGGPGSSPPRCISKCGRCTPCRPVHVPVPPGTPVTTEYYPEAWRCKCGNKLYMP
ncbi:polygalacturonase-like isoform X1 [Coffea arabica]|uniref:Epidermal patterning factor-like protein n=2 Tax=Coffea arabica TaxID=13443 RepID=A0A6P6UN59_COFAR|nr:polygalacturonase-like isoform X1 [Coffea arabica]